MNRRKFLQASMRGIGGALLIPSPLNLFLSNVIGCYSHRALAETLSGGAGYDDRYRLISISLAGAPARWGFDGALQPGGNDPFRYNGQNSRKESMLITKLTPDSDGINGVLGSYATHEVGGVHLPHLWSGKIATPNQGSTSMSNLASNLLIMRGVRTRDGHSLSAGLPLNPGTGDSLGGLMAGRSKLAIPSIGYHSDARYYQSSKGIPETNAEINNPISTLLSGFASGANLVGLSETGVGEKMDLALQMMKEKAGSLSRMVPISYEQRLAAKKLMKLSYGDLTGAYASLYSKYKTLISRSFTEAGLKLSDVDGVAIAGAETNPFKVESDGLYGYYKGQNLSTMIPGSTLLKYLAEGMAVTEFMMTGGGVKSASNAPFLEGFSCFSNVVAGVSLQASSFPGVEDASDGGAIQRISLDGHKSGSIVQMVVCAAYFRAISSCIYELITQLKKIPSTVPGRSRFDDTVIYLGSEFARDANDDASGTGHGWKGAVFSIFSGMVKSPTVLGNIQVTGSDEGKRNTWGEGAPVKAFTNQVAGIGNVVSTVAGLLDLPSPTRNSAPFAKKGPNGWIETTIGEAENVE